MTYPDLFQAYKPLKGRDWIKTLPDEDKKVFIQIGLEAGDHGRLGGIARAETAKRDRRGHFVKDDGSNKLTGKDPVKGTCQDADLWRD